MDSLTRGRLTHDRYCEEIVVQTGLLRAAIAEADMTAPVPSCPGWNVGQLLRHLGGGQRWAEQLVRTRAAPPPDDHFRDLTPYADEDAAELDGWLAECAGGLADALRETGPDAAVWTPVPGQSAAFFARRFAHETVIHRADAELAIGSAYALDPEVGRDALEEWLELGSLPMMLDVHPAQRELLGPGRTLRLHATDLPATGLPATDLPATEPPVTGRSATDLPAADLPAPGQPAAAEAGRDWLVDLTGGAITWRRSAEPAAVTLHAPLTDLLLIVYRRRPPTPGPQVRITGDTALLDFWLDRVSFG
ncbi:maleylpyruvate isomerase N-terminal domain-containing protein [Streptomyces sp. 796.1]|uniref:maleylpyruvate isomerase N-terminal domain-containing protein n=1 Tax=Streptomyces sp. 796.1 TaxID=3163029 RepID=UPI0039C8EB04